MRIRCFKPSETFQNRVQLLEDVIFCMNNDPRRTHIYGVRFLSTANASSADVPPIDYH